MHIFAGNIFMSFKEKKSISTRTIFFNRLGQTLCVKVVLSKKIFYYFRFFNSFFKN
jgi:hypothetical protein